MLKITLLHPEILEALASNGHGAKVLIADGNFPFTTGVPAAAKKVFLNFAPGKLTAAEVLTVLAEFIPIEKAAVMMPPDETASEIQNEFQAIIGPDLMLTKLETPDFYRESRSTDTTLVIATGEIKRFANILLTIGVVK